MRRKKDIISLRNFIYILFVSIIILYSLFFTDFGGKNIGTITPWSDNWIAADHTYVNTNKITAKAQKGNVVIRKVLPLTLEDYDAVCLMTHNSNLEVYVGDEFRYGFTSEDNITGAGYSDIRHSIYLTKEDAGKEVRIEFSSVFHEVGDGNVENIYLGNPDDYEKMLVCGRILPALLSLLIIFFGALMIGIFFFLPKKDNLPYNVMALGTSSILMGFWCLFGTGLIQLITGCIIGIRIFTYLFILFASYPIFCFVNSYTIRKRKLYNRIMFGFWLFSLTLLMFLHFGIGIDAHSLMILLYIQYGCTFAFMGYILVDDLRYCKNNNLSKNRRFFAIAAGCFFASAALDMLLYFVFGSSNFAHGNFVRLGLCAFIFIMVVHFLNWWSGEQKLLERTSFINNILRHAVSSEDPETNINEMLNFLVARYHIEKAFIFEKQDDESFTHTYEASSGNGTINVTQSKVIPHDGYLQNVFQEIMQNGMIIISDISELLLSGDRELYNHLHRKGINNIVFGSLEANGKIIGVFGVENVLSKSNFAEITEIIRLLSYFFGQLLLQRDTKRTLIRYGFNDLLTGAGNRRAFERFERESLDTNSTYAYIMCDINGLKRVNDSYGHEKGDAMIKYVADAFMQIFGEGNVYRMGGDEFVAFSFAESEGKLRAQIDKVKKRITDGGYTASIGYVYCEKGNIAYPQVKLQADQLMYQEKDRFYQGVNDRRRI